jgi:hypothetical protein
MRVYGDEYTEVKAIVDRYSTFALRIELTTTNKKVFVPRFLIKEPLQEGSSKPQSLKLPNWFLKKTRILPFHIELNTQIR